MVICTSWGQGDSSYSHSPLNVQGSQQPSPTPPAHGSPPAASRPCGARCAEEIRPAATADASLIGRPPILQKKPFYLQNFIFLLFNTVVLFCFCPLAEGKESFFLFSGKPLNLNVDTMSFFFPSATFSPTTSYIQPKSYKLVCNISY